jgi:hypothetical protein
LQLPDASSLDALLIDGRGNRKISELFHHSLQNKQRSIVNLKQFQGFPLSLHRPRLIAAIAHDDSTFVQPQEPRNAHARCVPNLSSGVFARKPTRWIK